MNHHLSGFQSNTNGFIVVWTGDQYVQSWSYARYIDYRQTGKDMLHSFGHSMSDTHGNSDILKILQSLNGENKS